MHSLLQTDDDLNQAIRELIAIDARFGAAYEATGDIPLRRREGGYSSIIRTIIGQQVSVAAANSIWARLQDAGLSEFEKLRNCEVDELRNYGLSQQKARYLLELANAGIDFNALARAPDEEVIKTLTAVKGIGLWTAEIYLMFALGRSDVFAAGDLALQEAARILFELKARPNEKDLRKMAEKWSPHRNAAAQLLWAYYHVMKKREGIGA